VISSVFGIIILALVVWVLDLSNAAVKSVFLSGMQAFLSYNMGLFFLVFLFFSFMSYFSKESPVAYRPFSPVGTAVGITVGFWVASQVIAIASTSLSVHMLYTVSLYMEKGVFWVFLLVLFVGYAVFLARTGCCRRMAVEEKQPAVKTAVRKAGDVHRLYRSGNDRILGGVCGGIAEYLGADPVLIRLIWILGTFAWGAGIFFYIIAWIIIPRNPDHKWAER
jgi:phage shock protein C